MAFISCALISTTSLKTIKAKWLSEALLLQTNALSLILKRTFVKPPMIIVDYFTKQACKNSEIVEGWYCYHHEKEWYDGPFLSEAEALNASGKLWSEQLKQWLKKMIAPFKRTMEGKYLGLSKRR